VTMTISRFRPYN